MTAIEFVARLTPDAVLLDVCLPDQSGFEVVGRLALAHPPVAVLLTSSDFDASYYTLAERTGARGFVPKTGLARVDLTQFWGRPRRQDDPAR